MALVAPIYVQAVVGQQLALTVTVPADTTGWAATFSLRGYSGQTALVSKTIAGGGITNAPGASSSTLTVSLTASDLTLPAGLYEWDLVRDTTPYPVVDRSGFLLTPSTASAYPRLTNVATYQASLGRAGSTISDADGLQQTWALAAAEDAVKRACGRQFTFNPAYLSYLDATWTDTVALPETPVESVTSLYYDPGREYGSTTLLTAGTDYVLRPDRPADAYSNCGLIDRVGALWAGAVTRPPGLLGSHRSPGKRYIKVTYAAGYGNAIRPPEALLSAVFEAATVIRLAAAAGRLVTSESGEGESASYAALDAEVGRLAGVQWAVSHFRRMTI